MTISEPLPAPLPEFSCPTCRHTEPLEIFTRPGSDGSLASCPECFRDWRAWSDDEHKRFLYVDPPARWWPRDLVEVGHPTTITEYLLSGWLELYQASAEELTQSWDETFAGPEVLAGGITWRSALTIDETFWAFNEGLIERRGVDVTARLFEMSVLPGFKRQVRVLVGRLLP